MVLRSRPIVSGSVHVITVSPVAGARFVMHPLRFAVSDCVRSSKVTAGGKTRTGLPFGPVTVGGTTMLAIAVGGYLPAPPVTDVQVRSPGFSEAAIEST